MQNLTIMTKCLERLSLGAVVLMLFAPFALAQGPPCQEQGEYWQEYAQTLAVSRNRAEQELADVRLQLKRLQGLHEGLVKELKTLKEQPADAPKP